MAHGMSETERRFAEAEARLGFGGVLASQPWRWLNHPRRIAEASAKPYQLAAASRAGLRIPKTLITNDPTAAKSFVCGLPKAVYKKLSGGPGSENGNGVAIYTTTVDPGEHDWDVVRRTAHMFQEWVPKAFDVRLTVVGEANFATRIDAGSPEAMVDWRRDYDALTYSAVEVPSDVRTGVTGLLGELRVAYAALDFVVTPDQQWIFLEVNPNGQWGWIAHYTGYPIASTIADFLTDAHRDS